MSHVGLLLLAAGGSARMGAAKQLLRCEGQTLLRRAAETALASVCRPVIVVLGARCDALRPELHGLPVEITENPDWALGMGSSISAGVQAMTRIAGPELQ